MRRTAVSIASKSHSSTTPVPKSASISVTISTSNAVLKPLFWPPLARQPRELPVGHRPTARRPASTFLTASGTPGSPRPAGGPPRPVRRSDTASASSLLRIASRCSTGRAVPARRAGSDTPFDQAFDRLFAAPSGDDGTFEQLSVQEALGRLKPTQREIVMLHAITGMTFREIGRALSIPSATAASRYRLALEKMKAILDGESTHED